MIAPPGLDDQQRPPHVLAGRQAGDRLARGALGELEPLGGRVAQVDLGPLVGEVRIAADPAVEAIDGLEQRRGLVTLALLGEGRQLARGLGGRVVADLASQLPRQGGAGLVRGDVDDADRARRRGPGQVSSR